MNCDQLIIILTNHIYISAVMDIIIFLISTVILYIITKHIYVNYFTSEFDYEFIAVGILPTVFIIYIVYAGTTVPEAFLKIVSPEFYVIEKMSNPNYKCKHIYKDKNKNKDKTILINW